MPFESNRRFRLWDYNVSHNQMLLRSPKGADGAGNLDIIFWGVEYVGAPTAFAGIALGEAAADEVATLACLLGRDLDPSNVHLLATGDRRYLVVSAGYKVLQNDLDLFESSLESFSRDEESRDLGRVLVHS